MYLQNVSETTLIGITQFYGTLSFLPSYGVDFVPNYTAIASRKMFSNHTSIASWLHSSISPIIQ